MRLKTLCILLLFASLAAPLLGGWLWLEVEKKLVKREVKHRMMEGLDPSELTRLAFTPEAAQTALEWEHAGEFECRGEMYDVVESFKKGDSVVYLCWWDHEETALNLELRARVQQALQDDSARQEQQRELVFFLKNIFLEKTEMRVVCSLLFENQLVVKGGKLLATRCASPPGPPPELVWGN